MTIHASKLSTSKKYNKEVFCIMFAAKSVPAYRIRQQFRSGAKINAKSMNVFITIEQPKLIRNIRV